MSDDIHSQILLSELLNLPRKRSFYKITSLFTGPTLKQHSMFKKKNKEKKIPHNHKWSLCCGRGPWTDI